MTGTQDRKFYELCATSAGSEGQADFSKSPTLSRFQPTVRQRNITRNMDMSAKISKDIADSTHLPNFEILPYMQKDVREVIVRTKL